MSNSTPSTQRFSSRVSDYVKHRPDYPRAVVALLAQEVGLRPDWIIADVGCGTGISCRMFIENGNEVVGVEPNDAMRRAAEQEFAHQPRFRAVNGTAESTTLADRSVDLVVAAQAFHWFDRAAFAVEAKRILRPGKGGWIAVMWNTRQATVDAFAAEYDALLMRWGTDYKEVSHRTPMSVEDFTESMGAPFQVARFPNFQAFSLDELCGRVRSSSYTPLPGEPGHDELFAGVRALFERHQRGELVRFEYQTELFYGRLVSF